MPKVRILAFYSKTEDAYFSSQLDRVFLYDGVALTEWSELNNEDCIRLEKNLDFIFSRMVKDYPELSGHTPFIAIQTPTPDKFPITPELLDKAEEDKREEFKKKEEIERLKEIEKLQYNLQYSLNTADGLKSKIKEIESKNK